MTCNLQSYRYNNGDELAVPFLCRNEDGTIVDIDDLTITAELWVRGVKTLTLTEASGIEIVDAEPPDDDETPHGYLRLTETQADDLPHGRIAYFKLVFVDADGVTFSSEALHLNKELP